MLKKYFSYCILLTVFLGCKTKVEKKILPVDLKVPSPALSTSQIFRINYNVVDLENYKDSTKFIARIVVTKRFNKILMVELTEFSNWILLCVKQPFNYPYEQKVDIFHSSPFNQLCYDYTGEESAELKTFFARYNTGEINNITTCAGCLDPEPYEIEIYDHGKYSSLKRDICQRRISILLAI